MASYRKPGKTYVDPKDYKSVVDAVVALANELDRNNLTFGDLLGSGAFGEVFKGTLSKNGKSVPVAIKKLKVGSSKKDGDDFLSEAANLGQFNDANVIALEGVIFKDDPKVIVLEFMCNGDLKNYLEDNHKKFTVLELLDMARDVASGMKYLSKLGYIHRDIAARNILVNESTCKVADFGLSRVLDNEIYESKGGNVPIRWTAPEAIRSQKYSSSSDVWSFGILLWEIFSYGDCPYASWSFSKVKRRVTSGFRLPQPKGCPKTVHKLMLSCWDKDQSERPKFGKIKDGLDSIIIEELSDESDE